MMSNTSDGSLAAHAQALPAFTHLPQRHSVRQQPKKKAKPGDRPVVTQAVCLAETTSDATPRLSTTTITTTRERPAPGIHLQTPTEAMHRSP